MKNNFIKLIVSSAFLGFTINADARENIGMPGGHQTPTSNNQNRSVNAQCVNATAQIDLDINNVRAKILNGGDMWWDIFGSTNARYQVPKPTNATTVGPSSQFASSVWVGGYDAGGQLKVAAQTYRQSGNDYWPGPLRPDATTDASRCLQWDKFWKINRADVQAHYNWFWGVSGPPQTGPDPITVNPSLSDAVDQLTNWPAFGPEGQPLAPFYDANGDGQYDFASGDVPDFDVTGTRGCNAKLFGDQNIFWVFNDKGNIHTETGGEAIGLEIQAQAFAFQRTDELNNATFLKYKIINKSSFRLDSTFFGLWDDADLGYAFDDFVGCDVGLGLGLLFNGDQVDGPGGIPYGANPPAVGVDFFEGPFKDANGIDDPASSVPSSFLGYGDYPTNVPHNPHNDSLYIDNERLGMCKFIYFNNDFTPTGNPQATDDYYQYLTATWKDAQRITYGGDGRSGSVPCDYMFPGTSDPLGFGTNMIPQAPWDETSSHNVPADRRFVESAGPFKLQPGAVNYITIGVPWARATQGGNLSSLALVKGADIKAQNLFDNCFSTINGPTAPNLTIQELDKELILTWTNPKGSNNYQEKYTEDYNRSSGADSVYRFQGYMVYQLKDGSVGATDLYNIDKARLVFQCDKKDGVAQIVNYTNDVSLSALVPQEMVNGNDKGIVHSISVKTDKFATGDDKLVNHKTYYYAIVAYGYSPTQNPVNLNTLTDYSPFIAGNYYSDPTFYHSAIPHIPSPESGGTVQQSSYGMGPKLTRFEGQGNGGNVLEFTSSTIDALMSSSNGYRTKYPEYENSYGPVKIQVIDPLNVPENNEFQLFIKDDSIPSNVQVGETSKWVLKNITTGDTVASETSIQIPNEQIINGQTSGASSVIPKWGISVIVNFAYDPKTPGAVNNSFLEATMTFSDPARQWLTGVPDAEGEDQHNWIRSGTFTSTTDASMNDEAGQDDGQAYEKVIGGTWAPYRLCGYSGTTATNMYKGGPAWNNSVAKAKNLLSKTASVDVIITADKSKWTRCPVLEMGEESALAIGGTKKMMRRSSLSVDKNGLNATQAGFNAAEGNLNGATGMGWFPGYAYNLETGERLNMAFGEDSWLVNENGADMKWNPTSNDGVFNMNTFNYDPVFGGKHYIYVFGHNGDSKFTTAVSPLPVGASSDIPRYDEGKILDSLFAASETTGATDRFRQEIFADAMWVNIPLLAEGHSLFECDVKVRLRVSKSYQPGYSTTVNVSDLSANPINKNLPVYNFNTADIGTKTANADAAVKALDLINVVPNPYYAYSGYEQATGDNKVKITNIPEKCTVTIYTLNGTLVRTFKVDQPATAKNTMGIAVTSVEWDLKNQVRIPIASGLYIIHVEVPDVGEKTLKWFGVLRPLDLDSY